VNLNALKKLLVGSPLATAQARHERLTKTSALAVFSSDALSSVAYATEEILLILVLAGTAALHYSIPIGVAIAVLIAVVVSSYRQTIFAYPQGGGSYIVTKDNLGTLPGLISGGALLIDYVLTVAVSVAAGVAALTSAVPWLYPYRIVMGVAFVTLVTLGNLRGIRESGKLFSLPTYLFIDNWAPVSQSATAGPVTATVTARPTAQTWKVGGKTVASCDGPGALVETGQVFGTAYRGDVAPPRTQEP